MEKRTKIILGTTAILLLAAAAVVVAVGDHGACIGNAAGACKSGVCQTYPAS